MTLGGWIMLILSWGIILALMVFCYYKVFRIERENITPLFEIDTGDLEIKIKPERKKPEPADRPGPTSPSGEGPSTPPFGR
jgi:hypothetical protein